MKDLRLKETVYPQMVAFADDEHLHLPPAAFEYAWTKMRVRSAHGLLSYLRAFPTGIMFHFGIDMKAIRSLTCGLIKLLRGRVERKFLVKRKPRQFAMGALKPLSAACKPADPI